MGKGGQNRFVKIVFTDLALHDMKFGEVGLGTGIPRPRNAKLPLVAGVNDGGQIQNSGRSHLVLEMDCPEP